MSQEEKMKDAILKGVRISKKGHFRCPTKEGYTLCSACIFGKGEKRCKLIAKGLLNNTPDLLKKTFAKYPMLMFCYKEYKEGD